MAIIRIKTAFVAAYFVENCVLPSVTNEPTALIPILGHVMLVDVLPLMGIVFVCLASWIKVNNTHTAHQHQHRKVKSALTDWR